MNYYIAETSSYQLPSEIPIRRKVIDSLGLGDPEDLQGYDYKFLFYDVFRSGHRLVFNGPPLLNLADEIERMKFRLHPFWPISPKLKDINRTQRSSARCIWPANWLQIDFDKHSHSIKIQRSDLQSFKNKNVLFSLSKNNDLSWIRDWAKFYVSNHDVDAILLYDNRSDLYCADTIIETLRDIRELKTIVIVPWPYSYGPQKTALHNGKYINVQGQFCQAAMLEHARVRFLAKASCVINVDVDELVVTPRGTTLPSLVKQSKLGGVLFDGRWIEAVDPSFDKKPSYSDFKYYNKFEKPSLPKWAICPEKMPQKAQWFPHNVKAVNFPKHPDVLHRHFKGLNTGWKVSSRANPTNFDPVVHEVDHELINALARSGLLASEGSKHTVLA